VHDPDRERSEHDERDAPPDHEGRDQAARWVEPDDREGAADSDAHPVDREREGELRRGQCRAAAPARLQAKPAQRGLTLL
jgi:hypothetical protein